MIAFTTPSDAQVLRSEKFCVDDDNNDGQIKLITLLFMHVPRVIYGLITTKDQFLIVNIQKLLSYLDITSLFIVSLLVGHENQDDDGAIENFWMDIQRVVRNSPSGSVLRDLACVDLQVDLCTHMTTEYQSRPEVYIKQLNIGL